MKITITAQPVTQALVGRFYRLRGAAGGTRYVYMAAHGSSLGLSFNPLINLSTGAVYSRSSSFGTHGPDGFNDLGNPVVVVED